jgi:arylformamidase
LSNPVYLNYSQEALDRAYDQRAWAANAGELIEHYGIATASGVNFVAPDFTNLPEQSIPGMIGQLTMAIEFITSNASRFGGDPDRIFLSGHSSGAHLCAVLLAHDWTKSGLPADVLKAGLCIGGIYDLEPVVLSSRRSYVHLTPEEALRFSPAREAKLINCPMAIAYGGQESPEFIRQAISFADALEGAENPPRRIVMKDMNHFEIAMELGRRGSSLHQAALEQITATRDGR